MNGWLRSNTATVVDLFAGTGGMGLASLLATPLKGRSRIVHTAELNPAYVQNIKQNYNYYSREIGDTEQVPAKVEPSDVSSRQSLSMLDQISRRNGGVTLLLAGPPCQGFSMSNRISRDHVNPQNLLALDTIDAIRAASPKIAIIENVPGIQQIRSARRRSLTVSEHIEAELLDFGYDVSTVLLDAADYGVPQHRLRSFTIAVNANISPDLGLDSFVPPKKYGPGRKYPYRSVRDAFEDLPKIRNGAQKVAVRYSKPPTSTLQRELRRHSSAVFDHVTTLHSEYVLERYAAIPRGGNWRSIESTLTNYTVPENTHNNIYHRLDPDKPSKTIGNFRKAMTIHPWENRGLSLREAARLQSLPDWLRFFGDSPELYRGTLRGLGVWQQQIGNAVCFRLTRELISHLFTNA